MRTYLIIRLQIKMIEWYYAVLLNQRVNLYLLHRHQRFKYYE